MEPMMPCKLTLFSMAYGDKTTQHRLSSTKTNRGDWSLFCITFLLEHLLPRSSIFVSYHIRTQFQSKFQYSRHLWLWLDESKGFFLAFLPNNVLALKLCLIVNLETWWPQNGTIFCKYLIVILRENYASLTSLLTVGVSPFPGRFITTHFILKLIITLTVDMGISSVEVSFIANAWYI